MEEERITEIASKLTINPEPYSEDESYKPNSYEEASYEPNSQLRFRNVKVDNEDGVLLLNNGEGKDGNDFHYKIRTYEHRVATRLEQKFQSWVGSGYLKDKLTGFDIIKIQIELVSNQFTAALAKMRWLDLDNESNRYLRKTKQLQSPTSLKSLGRFQLVDSLSVVGVFISLMFLFAFFLLGLSTYLLALVVEWTNRLSRFISFGNQFLSVNTELDRSATALIKRLSEVELVSKGFRSFPTSSSASNNTSDTTKLDSALSKLEPSLDQICKEFEAAASALSLELDTKVPVNESQHDPMDARIQELVDSASEINQHRPLNSALTKIKSKIKACYVARSKFLNLVSSQLTMEQPVQDLELAKKRLWCCGHQLSFLAFVGNGHLVQIKALEARFITTKKTGLTSPPLSPGLPDPVELKSAWQREDAGVLKLKRSLNGLEFELRTLLAQMYLTTDCFETASDREALITNLKQQVEPMTNTIRRLASDIEFLSKTLNLPTPDFSQASLVDQASEEIQSRGKSSEPTDSSPIQIEADTFDVDRSLLAQPEQVYQLDALPSTKNPLQPRAEASVRRPDLNKLVEARMMRQELDGAIDKQKGYLASMRATHPKPEDLSSTDPTPPSLDPPSKLESVNFDEAELLDQADADSLPNTGSPLDVDVDSLNLESNTPTFQPQDEDECSENKTPIGNQLERLLQAKLE